MTIAHPSSVIQHSTGAINFKTQASLTAAPFSLPAATLQMAMMDRSQATVSLQGCEVEHYAPVPHRGTVGTAGTWLPLCVDTHSCALCVCSLLDTEVERMHLDWQVSSGIT